MAEQVVSKNQFEEFTKRIEQGFEHVNQQMNQQFAQVNQQLADMRTEMRANNTDFRAEIRQMRGWLIGLYGIVVFGFIGSIFRPRSWDRPLYAFRGGFKGAGASSTDSKIAANIERGF